MNFSFLIILAKILSKNLIPNVVTPYNSKVKCLWEEWGYVISTDGKNTIGDLLKCSFGKLDFTLGIRGKLQKLIKPTKRKQQ